MFTGIFFHDIQFFRFYQEGVFLDCLIKGVEKPIHAEQIQHWFRQEKLLKGLVKGYYSCKDKRITFSTPGHFGQGYLIDYEGNHQKDYLLLNSLDHNTGHRVVNQIFRRLM
jgi:hypothetical protein